MLGYVIIIIIISLRASNLMMTFQSYLKIIFLFADFIISFYLFLNLQAIIVSPLLLLIFNLINELVTLTHQFSFWIALHLLITLHFSSFQFVVYYFKSSKMNPSINSYVH